MSFAADLERFANKAEASATQVYRKVAYELFRRVILRTPVDTGRLRGNWQTTLGAPAFGELDREDNSAPANQAGIGQSSAADDSLTTTLTADITDPLYLTNNLPYAQVIERGSSDQAPAGMVRVSITEFAGLVEVAANEL